MKPRTSWWHVIGPIILESIWVIDLAVDLYTGEVTCLELALLLMVCLLLAVFICSIIRRKKQKDREK